MEEGALKKLENLSISELEQGLANGRWGYVNSLENKNYKLAELVLARKKAEKEEKKFNDTLRISQQNADSTHRLVKATYALVFVTLLLGVITICSSLTNVNLLRPKYEFDMLKTQLVEMNLGQNITEFKLRFVIHNKHQGEGDISRPRLVLSAKGINEEYELLPQTIFITDTINSGNSTSIKTKDFGKTIHVGGYGIVDEFIEYKLYPASNQEDYKKFIFLNTNKDKLQFRIKGEPYKEISVLLVEQNKK